MNIDRSILERLRQFYAAELNAKEAQQVENLIEADEDYRFHNRLFHTVSKGIKNADTERGDDPFGSWNRAAIEGDASVLNTLKKHDKRRTSFRRLFILLLIGIVIGGVGYTLWIISDKPGNTNIPSEQPIANEQPTDDDEDLLGTTGNTISRTIPVFQYAAQDQDYILTKDSQIVLFRAGQEEELAYYFKGDRLLVLSKEYEILKETPIRLLKKEGIDTVVYHLDINGIVYKLEKDKDTLMPLEHSPEF